MRKKIVAGNWKMNLNLNDGLSLFSEIVNMVNDEKRGSQEVVIFPPFIHLAMFNKLSNGIVKIGAQNCYQENSGAFTGEISASMIRSTNSAYVLIGHSERRQYFAETADILLRKTQMALNNDLTPIFCVGETLDERNNGSYFNVLKDQLAQEVFKLSSQDFSKIVLAYEPVWAIGTGLTATPEQAQDIHRFLRTEVENQYGFNIADDLSILYGGSCNPSNASAIFAQPDIDGGLIGGASLKSRDFTEIIKVYNV